MTQQNESVRQTTPEAAPSVEDSARAEKLAEVELARQALAEKVRLADEFKDQWLRAMSDLDNYRKRVEKEKADIMGFAVSSALGLFLPVYEQLCQGLGLLEASKTVDPKVKEGFLLIVKNIEKIFSDQGLTKVPAKAGERYDPLCHEVVGIEEGSADEGLIVRVQQDGYRLGGRLLRPARIVVSAKAKNSKDSLKS
ncbi:MAG: nucleotide exchange factor GrpE [Elusimicrobia bacterium]|nr:nucleotide exchange factor GrpE [Elusimicrobiota bacterium]